MASDAIAQGSVRSDGGVTPIEQASTSVSPGFRGAVGEAGASAARVAPAEFARELALQGVTGPKGAEVIIGTDNRIKVNPTTVYPYRAIVLITFAGGRCSGWLIGSNTVVTAGHCLTLGIRAWRPVGSFRIYAGRNGNSIPYPVCTARWLATNTTWWNMQADDYDYGTIKLNCTVGNTVGWFGFFWTPRSLVDFVSFNSSYPGDKNLTQWRHTDYIRVEDARRLFYQNDTQPGSSGSPIYTYWRTCFPCGAAVHAYGTYNGPPSGTHNHGTRITQSVFNLLSSWKNAP